MSNYKTVSELLRECAEADFPLKAIEKKLGCSGVTLGETVNLLADEIDREKRVIYGDLLVKCEFGFIEPRNLTQREPDTQERIDEDATMPPREYYARHIGHDVGLKDDAEVTEAMMRDLLRRQRELDGRDA